jgi:hypothetical protein
MRGKNDLRIFFLGGILVSLYSYKEIYAMCCDVEGAESKSIVYVVKHSQRMFRPGWYVKRSSQT